MISTISHGLGPLFYPLLLCSFIALWILLERLVVLSSASLSRTLSKSGEQLMQGYQHDDAALRDSAISLWLNAQQRRLSSGLRVLHIIAIVSPLLGLLGTVLGLISVFDDLAVHQGPISPALLADGLGLAMKTTACGLLVAIPALVGAYLFQLWVDKLIGTCELELNRQSLHSAGLCTAALA